MKSKFALSALMITGFCLLAPSAFAADPAPSSGKVVALDEFYNHQVDKTGAPYHYIWADTKNTGFSKFGKVFTDAGAQITSIDHAPTADDLNKVSVYIIANPSIPANAADGKPNYIAEPSISVIEQWVKDGGVLLLLANDPGKCEFEHFNQLASRFGITYDGNDRNTAPKSVDRPHATFLRQRDSFPATPLFEGLDTIYMKEISSIAVKPPAEAVFVVAKDEKESVKTDDGAGPDKDVIIAQAQVGKGFVLAVGDPWVYNEYFNAPKDWNDQGGTAPWNNDKAAKNLATLLLQKSSIPPLK